MSHSGIRRAALAAVAAGLVASASGGASASAAQRHEATAKGSIGSVDVRQGDQQVSHPPIAPCDVEGDQDGSSGTVTVGGVATYWGGQTKCDWDASERARAEVTGRYFSTKAMVEWGGPRIKVSTFKVRCNTTANGSSASMQLTGVRGIDLPERIPSNYTVTIPGRIEGAKPLGKVIVNEVVVPDRPDGSMRVNAMHIVLFPEGGPDQGDIIVGTVHCDPFGG